MIKDATVAKYTLYPTIHASIPSATDKCDFPLWKALHNEKTHLATSIGIAAAKKRTSTYFIKCHDLILNLKKAQIENRLETRLKHYRKYKLLIIDEIGYLPISEDDATLFFQLIDMRYELRSTIFTTNANFKSWGEIFQDPKIANAILDRILHHATVVNIVGDSYRLKNHFKPDNGESVHT